VVRNGDGSYTVTGGDPYDGDTGVWVVDENGNRTGEKIGESLTPWDFAITDDSQGLFIRSDETGAYKHAKVTFDLKNLPDGNLAVRTGALFWGVIANMIDNKAASLATLAVLSRQNGPLDIKKNPPEAKGDKYMAVSYDGKITTARMVGNVLFGVNMRTIHNVTTSEKGKSASDFYHQTMKVVGGYNQMSNKGNGYNAGPPYYGEHKYSGSGIYLGFFGKNP
jgi:hypothetical protein